MTISDTTMKILKWVPTTSQKERLKSALSAANTTPSSTNGTTTPVKNGNVVGGGVAKTLNMEFAGEDSNLSMACDSQDGTEFPTVIKT